MIINPSQANNQLFLIGLICYLICFECEISWILNLITNYRQMTTCQLLSSLINLEFDDLYTCRFYFIMSRSSFLYETYLPDLGEKPNQPISFNFSKQHYGIRSATYCFISASVVKQWPCTSYNQESDRVFYFYCIQAVKQRGYLLASKTNNVV